MLEYSQLSYVNFNVDLCAHKMSHMLDAVNLNNYRVCVCVSVCVCLCVSVCVPLCVAGINSSQAKTSQKISKIHLFIYVERWQKSHEIC